MPRFALYDPSVKGKSKVTGWFDTDEFEYPNIPGDEYLLAVSDDQWESRLVDPNGFFVEDRKLTHVSES